MSFDKAKPENAARLLKQVRGRKGYKPPPKKRGRKKPGPKTLIRQVSKKRGQLSNADRTAIEALVLSVDEGETEAQLQQRGKAMGIALRRSPVTIQKAIVDARARLAERAVTYVDLHLQAATVAAYKGDSKPAEWALERITTPGEKKGTVERIVEPAKGANDQGPRLPTINLGIVLGGLMPGASLTPNQTGVTVDAVIEEGDTDE